MVKAIRRVRLAQIIGPFGPGAIVDLVGESFVAEDASRWRGTTVPVRMPRLAARLRVDELRSPSDFPGVPYFRFPTWLFCRRCRLMSQRNRRDEQLNQPPMCVTCADLALVPIRFVAICGDGHLTDIDWWRLAHRTPDSREQHQCATKGELHFINRPHRGSGLASLEIQCRKCDASQNLQGITSEGTINQKCPGRQPWQFPVDSEGCAMPLVGTQRGASNVYFPEIVSALDLPPDSDWEEYNSPSAKLRSNHFFRGLLKVPSAPVRAGLIDYLASEFGLSNDEVEHALATERPTPTHPQDVGTEEDIAPEEWRALISPRSTTHNPSDHFVTRAAPPPESPAEEGSAPQRLRNLLAEVILADRLREVRVLKGFYRYTADRMVSANLGEDQDFLPAIEVFGEGFFLSFDEAAIREWESRQDVQRHCRPLQDRALRADLRWLPPVSARYLMLHSLAHLLLRSTAFDAGYPVSALRERIYATAPDSTVDMAGILVYTAAGDTEGTLGGLVRMGEPDRLDAVFMNAAVGAQWCSMDPVCGELKSQGPSGLSLAACHACMLLPETSCQAGNRLLDRNLVVHPEFGFLAPLTAKINGLPGRGIW